MAVLKMSREQYKQLRVVCTKCRSMMALIDTSDTSTEWMCTNGLCMHVMDVSDVIAVPDDPTAGPDTNTAHDRATLAMLALPVAKCTICGCPMTRTANTHYGEAPGAQKYNVHCPRCGSWWSHGDGYGTPTDRTGTVLVG